MKLILATLAASLAALTGFTQTAGRTASERYVNFSVTAHSLSNAAHGDIRASVTALEARSNDWNSVTGQVAELVASTNGWTVDPHADWVVNHYSPTNAFTFYGVQSEYVVITGVGPGLGNDVRIPPYIGGTPVRSIGFHAFSELMITSVTFPETLTYIGEGAFIDCDALTDVILPEGVVFIDSGAFNSCDSLTNVVIPTTLQRIGGTAFSFCYNLYALYYWGDAPTLDSDVFDTFPAACTNYYISGHTGFGENWMPRLATFAPKLYGDGTFLTRVPLTVVTNNQSVVTVGTLNATALTVNGNPYTNVPIIAGTTNQLPAVANRTNGVLYVEIP